MRAVILKERKKKKRTVWSVSCSVVSDSAIPWTVALQAPLSMGFSRQEYRSRLPFPSPGGLPDPGIKFTTPALQAEFLPAGPPGPLQTLCRP